MIINNMKYNIYSILIIFLFLIFNSCRIGQKVQIEDNGQIQTEDKNADGLIMQTSDIPDYPDKISTDTPQIFPDIDDIINASAPRISIYGLFSWSTQFGTYEPWTDEISTVGWKSLRPGSNNDEFTNPVNRDDIMKNYIALGVDVMWTINGAGDYVRGNTDRYGAIDDPAGDTAFINDYIDLLLTPLLLRYGPNGTFFDDYPDMPKDKCIKYVEIWNEPNLYYLYGAGADLGTGTEPIEKKARLYAKLLWTAYNYIKNNALHPEWNQIQVIGMSACGGSRDDISWGPVDPPFDKTNNGFIRMVHKYIEEDNGPGSAAHCYDILSDHPYTHSAPPDAEDYPGGLDGYHYSPANSLAVYRQVMEDYGNGDKPVWFTEVGWSRETGVYPSASTPVTERLQAAYIVRLYLIALRLGVETAHVMYMYDYNRNFGFFVYETREWYESAYAVQNLIKIMPNPRITGAISDGANGYYAYTYKPDYSASTYTPVIVAWNVGGSMQAAIPVSSSGLYRITDMFGNETTKNVVSTLDLEIGPYPVYIQKIIE